jgi:hypothetical protein
MSRAREVRWWVAFDPEEGYLPFVHISFHGDTGHTATHRLYPESDHAEATKRARHRARREAKARDCPVRRANPKEYNSW